MAEQEFWKVSGADLFALTSPDGDVLALYADATDGKDRKQYTSAELMQPRLALELALQRENNPHFLVLDGRLFEFTFEPLYFGNRATGQLLGYVVIAYSVDQNLAREVSESAAAEVAFLAHGHRGCKHTEHSRRDCNYRRIRTSCRRRCM